MLATNQASDPSRTLTLRRQFEAEMYKRFRELKGLIRDAIVDKAALGDYRDPVTQREAQRGQFAFPLRADKIDAFMEWLREQQREGVLEVRRRRFTGREEGPEPWTNLYIRSAYQRGLARAWQELRQADAPVPSAMAGAQSGADAARAAFHRPFHADRVALLYNRAFSELEGITEAMDQQISRALAQGMAEGLGSRELAGRLNDRVDKIGITRARMLARTEVIRAHHSANIGTYKQAGVPGVSIRAEYRTAGDSRVCPICSPYDGRVMDLDAVEDLIPQHPNCRCAALPKVNLQEEAA